jgi:propionyl-CoA carboxylase beta chain
VRLTGDKADRKDTVLDFIIPADPNTAYDMKDVVRRVVDDENFFEIMPDFAKNIVVGFARMEGTP